MVRLSSLLEDHSQTPEFSVIATNFGRKFFELADGAVLEYKIEDSLAKFTYTGSILADVSL